MYFLEGWFSSVDIPWGKDAHRYLLDNMAEILEYMVDSECATDLDDRLDWDEWGLQIAQAAATRADCTRRKVAAVLMRPDHSIVSTGYNGGPSGGLSCLKGECPRGLMTAEQVTPLTTSYDTGAGACIALHAEQNALLRATWDEMQGATLYITCEPCPGCLRMIKGTPIARVVWPESSLDLAA